MAEAPARNASKADWAEFLGVDKDTDKTRDQLRDEYEASQSDVEAATESSFVSAEETPAFGVLAGDGPEPDNGTDGFSVLA